MSRARGFTLVEVLLAAVLAAVIGLAVSQFVYVAHNGARRTRARAEVRAIRTMIARRLDDDLRALVPPGGLYASGLVSLDGARSGTGEELLPAALQGATPVSGPTLEPPLDARDLMTMAVNPPALTWGDAPLPGHGGLWSVLWEVDDDPETEERGLVRRVVRMRDPLPGSEPEPVETLAAEAVGFDVRFWDGSGWVEAWDSGTSELLPLAVEVRVALVLQDELHVIQVVVSPVTARTGSTGNTQ